MQFVFALAVNMSPEHPADHHCWISELWAIILRNVKLKTPEKEIHDSNDKPGKTDPLAVFMRGSLS